MIGKASAAQIRKIHFVARQRGLESSALHSLVLEETGKEHISELNIREAITVIDRLEGKTVGRRFQQVGNRASQKQINYINVLIKELGWEDNPNRFQGFMKKYAKVENIIWLTPGSASALIEAMKKLLQKGYAERERVEKLS